MNTKTKSGKIVCIIGLVLLVMLLAAGIFLIIRYVQVKTHTAAIPTIAVLQPGPNQTLIKDLSHPVQVLAESSGGGITTLEWYLDGRLAGQVKGDDEELSGNWEWVPDHEGTYQLSFLAYAENGAMGLASLETAVLPGADVDGDGVLDEMDECPTEAGPAASGGCALEGDEDGDGLVGEMDACPEEAGTAEDSGCPAGMAPDRDGDGIPDASDRCVDESGRPDWYGCPLSAWSINSDGDELPDFLDDCPEEYGPRDSGGCPLEAEGDSDGDGVSDADDACADSPGPPSESGCPTGEDRDGDGLTNGADSCPDEAGPSASGGCPAADGASDGDLDGVPDAVDLCPDEIGLLEYSGCPMPDDRDGDGVPDADDRCADLPGSEDFGGCPFFTLPWREYADQFRILPEFASYLEREIMPSPPPEEGGDGRGAGGPLMTDDYDGDGVLDEEDDCDDQIGRPFNNGCPWIEGDRDDDRVPDDLDPCPDRTGPSPIEGGCPRGSEQVRFLFQLENFLTDPGWAGIYCYMASDLHHDDVTLEGHDFLDRKPIWNYATTLPREARTVDTRENMVVIVEMYCFGQPADWGSHSHYLGKVHAIFDLFYWDGQLRKARGRTPEGWFEVWYRITRLSWSST
jgi:hypothetical protein